jgi:hypothetical protein
MLARVAFMQMEQIPATFTWKSVHFSSEQPDNVDAMADRLTV